MSGIIIPQTAIQKRDNFPKFGLTLNFRYMKKILFAALPVVAVALMVTRNIGDPLAIGSSLPHAEKKMKDISGKDVSFKDAMKKNGLLVMFSCNTCPVVHKYE